MKLAGPQGAFFNESRSHRWLLWRRWADASKPDRWLMVIGLNPSKADDLRSDPTVSQMVNRGKTLREFDPENRNFERQKYTGLLMLNAYGVVGTYPSILKQHPDPVGRENMAYIVQAAAIAELIVCAWGTLAGEQGLRVERTLREAGHRLHVFNLTKDGCPRHPRGLSLTHAPKIWTP